MSIDTATWHEEVVMHIHAGHCGGFPSALQSKPEQNRMFFQVF
jgi:hypothetical protein